MKKILMAETPSDDQASLNGPDDFSSAESSQVSECFARLDKADSK